MSKNIFTTGNAQAYIDHLEAELKCAENDVKVANAYYNSAKSSLDEATIWDDKLKKYWEAIKKTDELAGAIIAEMDKLDQQSVCVCDNGTGYRDAVKVLLCCVKNVAETLDEMNEQLVDLTTRIDCIRSKDPVLDWSKSILKCLAEFKAKVAAALASALEALKACLALLRLANLVIHEKKALRSYIDWLQETAQVTNVPKAENPPADEISDKDCYPGPTDGSTPCVVAIYKPSTADWCAQQPAKPAPGLEISKSVFYTDSKTDFDDAELKKDHYKKEVDKAQMIRDGASAKRESAIRAFDDAKKAKQCK